jgi:hypothetical protein
VQIVRQALDVNTLALHALWTLFSKTATLKSQPGISDWLESHEPNKIDPTTANGKAWNRVLSSKATREGVSSVGTKWENNGDGAADNRKRKRTEDGEEKRKQAKKSKAEKAQSEGSKQMKLKKGVSKTVESTKDDGTSESLASDSPDGFEDDLHLPVTTTFLPTLSTGFTLGESDADDTDIEDEPVGTERRNRRGQRARRAYVTFVPWTRNHY